MEFIFIVIVLVMSVVIHEVSHGFAALSLGDPTAKHEGRLTLNPFSHLDPVGSFLIPVIGYLTADFIIGWAKPVPFNPYNLRNQRWGEALVALAGPLSNFALAFIFGLLLQLFGQGLNQAALGLVGFVIIINITLAIFNLVPIPPLDGSKILFSILPYRLQYIRDSLERYGLVLALIFVFFFRQLLNPLIGFLFKLFAGLAI